MQSTSLLSPDEKRPLNFYSCHDVTILSLLYGIDADIVARFWPPYATTLVFELVRNLKGQHFIRILLNGMTVRTKGLKGSLTLDDFSQIIQQLESMMHVAFHHISRLLKWL